DKSGRNLEADIREYKEKYNIVAFYGPLFSEDVVRLAGLAERLKVPFLAPLANTYNLRNDNEFIFQINPSFETRGTKTAQLAVNELNLRRFGVMVEKGTDGEEDARAFATEVEALGGEIVKFVSEDFGL